MCCVYVSTGTGVMYRSKEGCTNSIRIQAFGVFHCITHSIY